MRIDAFVVLYKIRVGSGGRHFDRGAVPSEMFAWLHLIDSVTVDCISGIRSAYVAQSR